MKRKDAEQFLEWGNEQNPGPWVEHCKVVGRVAEVIAQKSGLDADKAYAMGLMHDIGYHTYRNGKGETCHIYAGYKLMINKGYEDIARICLAHSFPYKEIAAYGGSDMYCTDEEQQFIATFLREITYDDYDKLIQLSDCLGTAQGVVMMEKRMMDVVRRHGFSEFTLKRWESFFSLKNYFDNLCGTNIYNLFKDEIENDIFR